MSKSEKHWEDVREADLQKRFEKKITGITLGHNKYLASIDKCIVTLCVGPAGSGKTYMAVAKAIEYLKTGKVKRIVITRPLVSCGGEIGFLPGDAIEKSSPYLTAALDVFDDFLSDNEIVRMMDEGYIEIQPLELLRGRSLKDAFIILEEAQNCKFDQLLMFLTRFGLNSKVVVSGDYKQSDLEDDGYQNPLFDVFERLKGIKEIGRVILGREDIVRSPLIKTILERLE